MYGEAGNDVLVGGFGADRRSGGAGVDTFRFLDVRDTGDTITDFTRGSDKIDLSHFKAAAREHDFHAAINATRFSAGHDLIWYYDGGNTIVLDNTDGNPNTAEFVLTLAGRIDLGAGDFLLQRFRRATGFRRDRSNSLRFKTTPSCRRVQVVQPTLDAPANPRSTVLAAGSTGWTTMSCSIRRGIRMAVGDEKAFGLARAAPTAPIRGARATAPTNRRVEFVKQA